MKKGRVIGHSCRVFATDFVHCCGKRIVGKSIQNITGELNHYDAKGKRIGYSRREHLWKVVHYDQCGKCIGKSVGFLWITVAHSVFPLFLVASANKRNTPCFKLIPYLIYNIILPSELVQSVIRFIDRVLDLCAHIKSIKQQSRICKFFRKEKR